MARPAPSWQPSFPNKQYPLRRDWCGWNQRFRSWRRIKLKAKSNGLMRVSSPNGICLQYTVGPSWPSNPVVRVLISPQCCYRWLMSIQASSSGSMLTCWLTCFQGFEASPRPTYTNWRNPVLQFISENYLILKIIQDRNILGNRQLFMKSISKPSLNQLMKMKVVLRNF